MKTKKIIAMVCLSVLAMFLTFCVGCEEKIEYKTLKLPSCDIEEIEWERHIYKRRESLEEKVSLEECEFLGFVINFDDMYEWDLPTASSAMFICFDKNNTIYNPCNDNCAPIYEVKSYYGEIIFLSLACDTQRVYYETSLPRPL